MNADDYPIENILKEGRRFMVPLYQRKYQWGDKRLIPFWEDVEAKANEVLFNESKFQHYMGALILAPLGDGAQIGVTPRVQVVDGQQRLTTFQLFLAALREVARKYESRDIVAYVEDYLFNQPKSKDSDRLAKFKLTPTPSDRATFHDILEKEYQEVRTKYNKYYWGSGVPKNTPLRALRAYEVFKQRIEQFVKYGKSATDIDLEDLLVDEDESNVEIEPRLEALLKAILNRMKLVVITLDESDDAQVIFETLNSKGEPLLAMDLVRNNIFYRAEKQDASIEELYKELWDPFDEPWWREPAPNARPKRPRIDHFLAHVLAAETGGKISMRELYAEYRAFAVPRGKPRYGHVEDELRLLERHAPTYETLEGRKYADSTLAWLGRKLATWQVTTAYPIAFQIANETLDINERKQIAQIIYSYIVRRALSGLTGKNLNQIFQSISQVFAEAGPSAKALAEFFETRAGDSTRFPNDEEFRQAILRNPAYKLAPGARIKDVLWELEIATRSKFAEKVEMPSDLWTEHVLPESWTDDWPLPDGSFIAKWSDDQRAIEREGILHTLGNLTLLTSKLNISSSNKPFLVKRAKFSKHTGLFLNKWFLDYSEWNETHIRERGKELADMAVEIWIGLDGIE